MPDNAPSDLPSQTSQAELDKSSKRKLTPLCPGVVIPMIVFLVPGIMFIGLNRWRAFLDPGATMGLVIGIVLVVLFFAWISLSAKNTEQMLQRLEETKKTRAPGLEPPPSVQIKTEDHN